ncbi:MAG: HEAT repeat domain-containing protein [Bryobacterales bacterium]
MAQLGQVVREIAPEPLSRSAADRRAAFGARCPRGRGLDRSADFGRKQHESRANAARAAGILRARAALPELEKALKSRDETIILEAVRSIEKIGDLKAGTSLVPLLRDPNDKIRQTTAEAVGQLRVREAVEDLNMMVRGDKNKDVQRAALTAMAKIPDNGQDKVFLLYLRDKDDKLRAAAAEGPWAARQPERREDVAGSLRDREKRVGAPRLRRG